MSDLSLTEEKKEATSTPRVTQTNTQNVGSTTTEQQLQRQLQRQEEQMQLIQQQVGALTALVTQVMGGTTAAKTTATAARHSISPTRATLSSPEGYSASAALPLPPVVGQRSRRQSYGMPTSAFTPSTPAVTRTVRQVKWSEDEDTQEQDGQAESTDSDSEGRTLVEQDKQWEKASKALASIIKPFYGQTNKDSDSVIDWVEKVDTIFSIRMKDRQEGRLDLVRQMLAGTALKWMNRRVQELNEQLSRGGSVELWNGTY